MRLAIQQRGAGVLGTLLACSLACGSTLAQNQPGAPKADRFRSLAFLEGMWEAHATRPDGVAVSGRYAFEPELNGTVLARHATTDPGCKGPALFDCAHSDLLYVFEDAPGNALKAIFFDSEGHVIHYDVHLTSPTAVEFVSEPAGPGPHFRLAYELKNGTMTGRFQLRLPGTAEWRSYLEWSGKQAAAAP